MSNKVELSLVICTRNRALQLGECLQRLIGMLQPVPWELVIVDNGSKDGTRDVAASYNERLPVKFVIEGQRGQAKARNRGWRIAEGTIVAFTDDDCYPAANFLSAIVQCFTEQPRLGFIGGRVLLFDPDDHRSTIQEKIYRQELLPGEFLPAGLIHGANFAFRRKALESVGGFDERFGPGGLFCSADDTDILARMLACGWRGVYDPRPLVYHHHRRKTEAEVLKLRRGYDRGRGAYYSKCLLNPKLHTAYVWNWCKAMRRQPWRTTARELAAGAEFLVRSGAAWLYPASGTERE